MKRPLNRHDTVMIFFLMGFALFIWFNDLSWATSPEDVLPLVLALPLLFWLSWPLRFRSQMISMNAYELIIPLVGILLGGIFQLTTFYAIAWTVAFLFWARRRLEPESFATVKKLIPLPLFAFPWLILDGAFVGWYFRLSGAWVAEKIYLLFQFNVIREGTELFIESFQISVGAPCSGLNTIQSMMVTGTCLAYIYLNSLPQYWLNLVALVFIAWLANTIRILSICGAALLFSPEFALGFFHDWGGLFVVVLMFYLCWMLFYFQFLTRRKRNAL